MNAEIIKDFSKVQIMSQDGNIIPEPKLMYDRIFDFGGMALIERKDARFDLCSSYEGLFMVVVPGLPLKELSELSVDFRDLVNFIEDEG